MNEVISDTPVDCSIVIPVFNEEQNIPELYARLCQVTSRLPQRFEFIFVDDGSTDGTFAQLAGLHHQDPRVKVLQLSRNFGHQIALTAGMQYARGAAVITMDGDLQHPPELIPELIRQWQAGYEVVYTIRKETKGAGPIKTLTARLFYHLLRWLTANNIPALAPDYRLLDRRAVASLNRMEERARFIRGMVSWIGFSQIGIEFVADPRYAGHSKYSLARMLQFALDAIVAFSGTPLRLAAYVGFLVSCLAFLYGGYAVAVTLLRNDVVRGWSSTILVTLVLGGFQLLALGIIGEYLDRIYTEVKRRPLFLVRRSLGLNPVEYSTLTNDATTIVETPPTILPKK